MNKNAYDLIESQVTQALHTKIALSAAREDYESVHVYNKKLREVRKELRAVLLKAEVLTA